MNELTPYEHQKESINALLENREFALFHETGMGKSKIVIEAASQLFLNGVIDTVVVVAPSSVCSVWAEEDSGEIDKHCSCPYGVTRYGSRFTLLGAPSDSLYWVVTNYEFIRSKPRLDYLIKRLTGRRVMVALDEASYIKSRVTAQTKACIRLGEISQRRIILNGTPIMNGPLDLWSQFKFLNPQILGRYFNNFYTFRARYCVMGGFQGRQVLKYVGIDDLAKKTQKYVHRRTKEECLDLPEKVYSWREVQLSPPTWKAYEQMKKEMLAEFENGDISLAVNAITRTMRLSQMCGGFLGGIESVSGAQASPTKQLGTEKIDALIDIVRTAFEEKPGRKVVAWFRFRSELEFALDRLTKERIAVNCIRGGQTADEREDQLLQFRAAGQSVLLASTHCGGFGLTLTESDFVVYISNDYSYGVRKQSEDRTHRISQNSAVTYIDLVAVGPSGQQTIDHVVIKALRSKESLSTLTLQGWRNLLNGGDIGEVDKTEVVSAGI